MNKDNKLKDDLFEALLKIESKAEMARVMKDLCTPQEIKALAERWQICQLLEQAELSYRAISAQTGVSLATITRVARFFKDEPHRGYKLLLKRTK
jgi:TrpR-related protein YerC/YecD